MQIAGWHQHHQQSIGIGIGIGKRMQDDISTINRVLGRGASETQFRSTAAAADIQTRCKIQLVKTIEELGFSTILFKTRKEIGTVELFILQIITNSVHFKSCPKMYLQKSK